MSYELSIKSSANKLRSLTPKELESYWTPSEIMVDRAESIALNMNEHLELPGPVSLLPDVSEQAIALYFHAGHNYLWITVNDTGAYCPALVIDKEIAFPIENTENPLTLMEIQNCIQKLIDTSS